MTNKEFVAKALDICKNYKTLYVYGCWGAPMSTQLGPKQGKYRYSENNYYNRREPQHSQILNASEDTFGFDCVCLIKGIVWGWSGQLDRIYGGAGYNCNGLGDYNANGIIVRACYDVSTDFSKIVPGEIVWMDGHVGIYVGDGKVVEATDRWEEKVLMSYCLNVVKNVSDYHRRTWTKHAKLICIDYVTEETPVTVEPVKEEPKKEEIPADVYYKVQKGDNLTKIANMYNTTPDKIVELNKERLTRISRDFICTGWKLLIREGEK